MIDAADVAHELIAAEREHKAIGQFSDAHPDFDLATAYRIAAEQNYDVRYVKGQPAAPLVRF